MDIKYTTCKDKKLDIKFKDVKLDDISEEDVNLLKSLAAKDISINTTTEVDIKALIQVRQELLNKMDKHIADTKDNKISIWMLPLFALFTLFTLFVMIDFSNKVNIQQNEIIELKRAINNQQCEEDK